MPTTPTINWNTPGPIAAGTPLSDIQLNATANVAGSFVYYPGAGAVLGVGAHTLSVVFAPTDTTDYTTATATVQITVNAAHAAPIPQITWPTSADIAYGTALSATQLNASANVPGSFSYSPAAGTVPHAGDVTLTATLTPTDTTDYQVATAQVTLHVARANPVITWSTPAPISQGTALGGTQLNATANVPGSFVYNPPAGTILVAGEHALTVTFTPSDQTDYNSVGASVTLQVTQGAYATSPRGMPVIPLPAYPAPRQISFTAFDSVALVESPFTMQTQVQQWPGADRWEVDVSYPPMTRAQAEQWIVALLALRGSANVFQIGDPVGRSPQGNPQGAPVFDGAQSITSTVWTTRGWTPNCYGLLLPGDYVQVAWEMYKVLTPVNSDANGKATLNVWPSTRGAYADGWTLTFDNCKALFRLKDNRRTWSIDEMRTYGISFKAIEDR